jgi:hypothetical protein
MFSSNQICHKFKLCTVQPENEVKRTCYTETQQIRRINKTAFIISKKSKVCFTF